MRNTNNYFVTEYKYPPVEAVKDKKNLKHALKTIKKNLGKSTQFIFKKKYTANKK